MVIQFYVVMEQHPQIMVEEHVQDTMAFVIGTIQFMKNIENIKLSTMDKIYQIITLKKQSFFHKLFKQQPIENAIIELNNLLATKEINEISATLVNDISLKYKIDVVSEFPKNILESYAAALKNYLQNNRLSDDEVEKLETLKQIFRLTDFQVENIHEHLAGKIYEDVYKSSISDGRLSDEKNKFLENLQKDLKLPNSVEKRISEDVRTSYLNNYVQKAVLDQRLSPTESTEIEAITKSLNINVTIDSNNRAMLDRYKLYWVLENGEIPTIETGLNLQRGEACYFKTYAHWYEYRTVTNRKIMEGQLQE